MRILFVYRYATFGGVERVLLNRAGALYEEYGMDLLIDLLFLWDGGAFNSINNGLPPNCEAFLGSAFHKDLNKSYDMIFIVDTPSFYNYVTGYRGVLGVECHTLYKDKRLETFKDIPQNVSVFVVPTLYQKELIEFEFPEMIKDRCIFILPNFVPDYFYDSPESVIMPEFVQRPVAFFHRLDDLKNYREAVSIFSRLLNRRRDVVLLISGKIDNSIEKTFNYLYEKLKGNFCYLPKVNFSRMPGVLKYLYSKRGIFLSTSKGESFGMSVAEAMSVGVPVLLSNIPPHCELVNNDEKYLYRLGDLADGVEKLNNLLSYEYEKLSAEMKELAQRFRKIRFLEAWKTLMSMFLYNRGSNSYVG